MICLLAGLVGIGDKFGSFDSGLGGLVIQGGRKDPYDSSKIIGFDNGFDNGYKRGGYDNGFDNGQRRGRYDNGRDDNGWKYGRDDRYGGVVVDGGDTTIVHVSKPGGKSIEYNVMLRHWPLYNFWRERANEQTLFPNGYKLGITTYLILIDDHPSMHLIITIGLSLVHPQIVLIPSF